MLHATELQCSRLRVTCATPLFCREHISDDMVNVIFSVCAYPDCPTLPSVNVQGSATPLFCRKHKSDDMVNVIANCAPNQNAPRNRALMFKAAPRPYFAASTNPLFSHFRTHLCRYSTLKVTEWTSFRLFSRKYSSKTLDNSCMSF